MFGPQCCQRSHWKGTKGDWVHTQYWLINWCVWSLHCGFWVCHSFRYVTTNLITYFFVHHLAAVIQGVTGYLANSTHCFYTGCYWMVPVRHFLLLYMTLVDSWRTPLVVVQGVIEWSVRHFLVLCRVGRNTCQSMFNMVLLLSEFWATLYIGRMEVFFVSCKYAHSWHCYVCNILSIKVIGYLMYRQV